MAIGLPRCSFWRRVYTRAAVLLLGLLAVSATPVLAQVNLSVHPAMTKGPADAPVVIVEFLDYQ